MAGSTTHDAAEPQFIGTARLDGFLHNALCSDPYLCVITPVYKACYESISTMACGDPLSAN